MLDGTAPVRGVPVAGAGVLAFTGVRVLLETAAVRVVWAVGKAVPAALEVAVAPFIGVFVAPTTAVPKVGLEVGSTVTTCVPSGVIVAPATVVGVSITVPAAMAVSVPSACAVCVVTTRPVDVPTTGGVIPVCRLVLVPITPGVSLPGVPEAGVATPGVAVGAIANVIPCGPCIFGDSPISALIADRSLYSRCTCAFIGAGNVATSPPKLMKSFSHRETAALIPALRVCCTSPVVCFHNATELFMCSL